MLRSRRAVRPRHAILFLFASYKTFRAHGPACRPTPAAGGQALRYWQLCIAGHGWTPGRVRSAGMQNPTNLERGAETPKKGKSGPKVLGLLPANAKLDYAIHQVDSSRVYRFTFLDTLSSAPNKPGFASPARSSTPAGGASSNTKPSAPGMSDEDILERRELDQTLGEAAAIGLTWATYRRFLNGRLRVRNFPLYLTMSRPES